MQKLIMILFAVILLLNLNSCKVSGEINYNIKDALKISTWVFDENSGEDFFIDCGERYDYNKDDSVFAYEQLKMNKIKLMPPLGEISDNTVNLNIFIEFDGIIEVISEDKNIQLSFNASSSEPFHAAEENYKARIYGFEVKFLNEGFVTINPLGSNTGHTWVGDGVSRLPHYVGREYYLSVNAYKMDKEELPFITVRLKLVQLEDKTEPENKISRCFSIELISYEYSDMYKEMYGAYDEDE